MMTLSKVDLAREALELSLEVRDDASEDYNSPINIFDLCGKLTPSVRVHVVDWSMEACYRRCARPLIEVSALRPLGRRVFNCAHELGHHVAGHGSTIDELQDEDAVFPAKSPEEYFANAFAGFLLMPKLGVRRAFTGVYGSWMADHVGWLRWRRLLDGCSQIERRAWFTYGSPCWWCSARCR
jgi:hypothetical protein